MGPVLINKKELVASMRVTGKLRGSDHNMIELMILRKSRHEIIRTKILDFKGGDFILLRDVVGKVPRKGILKIKTTRKDLKDSFGDSTKSYSNTVEKCNQCRRPMCLCKGMNSYLKIKSEAYRQWKEE